MEEKVILVNENDEAIGTMEKLEAHQKGMLHRAFSVFIFNSKDELLLQRRAMQKYHSPGLWTNTCCSHPRPDESVLEAAKRRLKEEMGMECEMKSEFSFLYKVKFDNGLTEHELDHVLIGYCDAMPEPDPGEVGEWKYVTIREAQKDVLNNPQLYTEWFKIIIDKMVRLV